jgi:glycerate-2-kinase
LYFGGFAPFETSQPFNSPLFDQDMKLSIDFHNQKVRTILKQLLQAGLHAADPILAMKKALSVEGSILRVGRRHYDLTQFDRIVCVGGGKASGKMAIALEQRLGSRLSGGLVAVKNHSGCKTKYIRVVETRHPIPDGRSVQAAKEILTLAQSLTRRDLLVVLVSGGASSLLAAPASGLTLTDKKHTTTLLLRSGATIQEINTVRKHLSAIKGGQLAAATSATIVSLVLSDVQGDDLATIGSGPTAPDPTTCHDAQSILKKFQLWSRVSTTVRVHLEKGIAGHIADTPTTQPVKFARVHHAIIGNNRLTVDAIAKQAKVIGLHPLVLTTTLEGEAREIGKMIGTMAKEIQDSGQPVKKPACLLWGGEPTVTVKGKGKGGRAQELVLSAAIQIAGLLNMCVAGFGTDGSDGQTDMAGAIVDGLTIERALKKHVDPWEALDHNNSYSFFKKIGGHIHTGTTGTNVNDVYVLLAL